LDNCNKIINDDKSKSQHAKHIKAGLKFNTIRQKLAIHDKLEQECKAERHMLVKLIRYYKVVLKKFLNEGKIDITSDIQYLKLKDTYKATEGKLMDVDYFRCLLGKNFEEVSMYLNNFDVNSEAGNYKK
jgi:hypothetical protein